MPFVKPDPKLFANLFGSRSTLAINLAALVVAIGLIFEGAYIVHERTGRYLPQDAPVFLFPAFVMFVIRNRIFSCCFFALYVAVSVQMSFEARSIHLGTYKYAGEKGPLGVLPIIFVVSAICLASYVVGKLISVLVKALPDEN